ncbi:DUF2267 domain-containing protein [Halalkalicoccus salilacus]|uniref:DUF2267 domain-containing protein n=1 Tax=Halalkalicoccus sp. GCM10025704 TaxID=3252662 RepID=UPI00360B350F
MSTRTAKGDRRGRDPPGARYPNLGGTARGRRGATARRTRRRVLRGDQAGDDLTAEEFLERVENEEQDAGIGGDTEEHVGAVLSTFEETIDTSEWQGIRSQLPDEYDGLLR